MPLTPAAFRKAVLRWFDAHGRHDLPWQHEITPYRVWVSEVMLQQTQVSTVIPYFERFLQRFPDVHSLARAKEDTVLHLWTGLGYYSRARHLHRCAQIIARDFGGKFPDTVEALAALPGIGRSTAGAIVSIAFGRRAAILDGNVKRVLARYHTVDGWPGDGDALKTLWQLAETCTPSTRTGDYSQAMMDLGATVCTRSRPDCSHCPLSKTCGAHASGTPTRWPQARGQAAKKIPHKHWQLLWLEAPDGSVLLEKRPARGIWGGLWCLPVSEQGDALALAREISGRKRLQGRAGTAIGHAFSHFRVTLQPVHVRLPTPPAMAGDGRLWYNGSQRVGLPAPVKALLDRHRKPGES